MCDGGVSDGLEDRRRQPQPQQGGNNCGSLYQKPLPGFCMYVVYVVVYIYIRDRQFNMRLWRGCL